MVVIDVRPEAEYAAGHQPCSRSMPLAELARRLADPPAVEEIVACCLGPYCLMSDEAVGLLRQRGYSVRMMSEGGTESRGALVWRATRPDCPDTGAWSGCMEALWQCNALF